MHFGENQLSRNLIGLSPLAPSHPPGFQPRWVRSSTRSYPRFNLLRARSSRFGSRTRDFKRLLRLAFATHTPHGLCSPHATDSQTHFSIGTPSPHKRAPTVRRRMVSETVSLPSRGTFHHSLTVLIHYRSPCPSRLTQWSGQIHTRFHEPRATREQNPTPRIRNQLPDSHGLRPGIPTCSPRTHKGAPRTGRFSTISSHNPAYATPAEYHTQTV